MEKEDNFKAVLKRLPWLPDLPALPCRRQRPLYLRRPGRRSGHGRVQGPQGPGAIISRAAQEISYRRKLVETCQNGFHKLQLADAGI